MWSFLLSLGIHAKGKSMNKTIGLFQHLFEEFPQTQHLPIMTQLEHTVFLKIIEAFTVDKFWYFLAWQANVEK